MGANREPAAMNDDLIKRLRILQSSYWDTGLRELFKEAADEIEHMQEELDALESLLRDAMER